MKMEDDMSINVYDLIDKKIKYQFEKKDQLNEDLREQLYRIRVELFELKQKYQSIEKESEKFKKNEKASTNVIENIKKRIEQEDCIEDKKEIIDYYFDVILCLENKYEVPPCFGVGSIDKMINYYFYVYNDYKDIVRDFLLGVLPNNYRSHIFSASSYIVPQKVPKDVLIKLIEEQPYYTNGGHYDWSECCFPDRPPYSEYMKNPLMLDEEVFQCLCHNVCRHEEGDIFLKVIKYQVLSNKQIEMLGDGMLSRCRNEKAIRDFFEVTHKNLSIDFHRKIFEKLGYSTNKYRGEYILNYKDEIIKEILSDMDDVNFQKLYDGTSRNEILFKMYLELIRNK